MNILTGELICCWSLTDGIIFGEASPANLTPSSAINNNCTQNNIAKATNTLNVNNKINTTKNVCSNDIQKLQEQLQDIKEQACRLG